MSSYGRYYRPALKSSVDVQLQTAFNEGLWPTVIRLAAQRHKTKKDPYYEVRPSPELASVPHAIVRLTRPHRQ